MQLTTMPIIGPAVPGDGGRPTVGVSQLRKFPPPRARWMRVSACGESRGKGTETTQIRSIG